MTFEEKLEELENKKKELQIAFKNDAPLKIEKETKNGKEVVTYTKDDLAYFSAYIDERKKLDKEIDILKLDNDYENKRPIMYHYIDSDGSEEDIELEPNDVNYTKAYERMKRFIKNEEQTLEEIMNEISDKKTEEEINKIMKEIHSKKDEQKQKIVEDKKTEKVKEKKQEIKAVDKPYTVFRYGDNIQIIGHLTKEEVKIIKKSRQSDLLNRYGDGFVTTNWNNPDFGYANYPGVKVHVDSNGYFEVNGADEIEYHNNPVKMTDKIIASDDQKDIQEKMLSIAKKPIIPATAKKVTRKPRNKKLISKLKKHLPKIILGAAAIAIIGIALYHFNPEFSEFINNLTSGIIPKTDTSIQTSLNNISDGINQITKRTIETAKETASNSVNNTIPNITSNTVSSIDWSEIGQGDTVFRSAYDAVSGSGSLSASEWFSENPLDVFNTSTGEFLKLTQEQLNNPEFLKTLANDPNNAILFGNSMQDPSGFMNLSEALSEVAKGGMHI